jgi:hypothetical protein
MAIAFLGLAASAQTHQALYITGTAETLNFIETPTVGFFEGSIGWHTRIIGLEANVMTDSKFQTDLALGVGIKAYGTIINFDNMSLKVGLAAQKLLNKPKHTGEYAYRPGLSLSIPLFANVDAKIEAFDWYHKDITKHYTKWSSCPGLSFAIAVPLYTPKKLFKLL